MTDREAMKMALEALETKGEHHERVYAAIEALRHALEQPEQDAGKCVCGANLYINENGKPCSKAQPEQEPVAHMYPSTLKDFENGEKADYAYSIKMGNMDTGEETVPLYTVPPSKPYVWLTDDEIKEYSKWFGGRNAVKAVEAALRRMNT